MLCGLLSMFADALLVIWRTYGFHFCSYDVSEHGYHASMELKCKRYSAQCMHSMHSSSCGVTDIAAVLRESTPHPFAGSARRSGRYHIFSSCRSLGSRHGINPV